MFRGRGNKAYPPKDIEKECLEVKRKTKEETRAVKERFKKEGVISCVLCY